MTYQKIKVERTARYYVLGEVTQKTKYIWVCFHGFGQLASFFKKKFELLVNEETVVIVPEGLSRFYLDVYAGRIGASWITSDMKEDEVEDYLLYLNSVFNSVTENIDLKNIKLNVLGFSQGCTTACRWLNQIATPVSNFIIWAAYFNKGIEDVIDPQKLRQSKNFYVYGTKDVYLKDNPELILQMKTNMIEIINAEIITFEGDHKIEMPVLEKVLSKISYSNS
jgi:predicted esterase